MSGSGPLEWAAGAAVIFVVAPTLLALAVRKCRLLLLARRPRLQIAQLTWADSSRSSEAVWITSMFHEHLAALRTDPLDPLPERAPSAPFVEIVEGVAAGAARKADLSDSVGRLFRALWPDAAYEVWGTLRPDSDEGGRVSVQLVDRARGRRRLGAATHRRGEWEMGAKDAAMAIAGLLYPSVAEKHRGPWAHWKEAIPARLVGAYYDAQTHEAENRFEEAMAAYGKALEGDPMNPYLRLKIATLQERLGLYLDAWVTYRAIVEERKRRAWKGPHRRARLVALYRLAILVSNGSTAEQWAKNDWLGPGEGNRRDGERSLRRRELSMALKNDALLYRWEPYIPLGPAFGSSSGLIAMLRAAEVGPGGSGKAGSGEEARRAWAESVFAPGAESESDQLREERVKRIDAVLQTIAMRRLEELDSALRARPPFRMRQWGEWIRRRPRAREWLRRRQLARAAIRVSKLLVRVRLTADFERLAGENRAEVRTVRREHHWLTLRRPFPATTATRKVLHFLAPRWRWADRRADSWQLHYNAACAVAAVLLDGSVMRNSEAEGAPLSAAPTEAAIIRRAVEELEEYAFRAGSGRVAAQADWVAAGDPDLQGLKSHGEFELWAAHYLPSDLPGRRLRGNVDVNRFTARLTREAARVFAAEWLLRAGDRDQPPPAQRLAYWWSQERGAWVRTRQVLLDRGSWQQRFEAIGALRAWLRETKEREYWIQFAHETDGAAQGATPVRRQVLEGIASLVGDDGQPSDGDDPTVLQWIDRRESHLGGEIDAGAATLCDGSLKAEEEIHEALKASHLWGAVAAALDRELNGADVEPAVLLAELRENLREE